MECENECWEISLQIFTTSSGSWNPSIEAFSLLDLTSSLGFPGGSDAEESSCNAGDQSSIPGQGRSPGGGNGYLLQYSGLQNPMDRGDWWGIVHGVAETQTQLSN